MTDNFSNDPTPGKAKPYQSQGRVATTNNNTTTNNQPNTETAGAVTSPPQVLETRFRATPTSGLSPRRTPISPPSFRPVAALPRLCQTAAHHHRFAGTSSMCSVPSNSLTCSSTGPIDRRRPFALLPPASRSIHGMPTKPLRSASCSSPRQLRC
jgi:hypothetical protein